MMMFLFIHYFVCLNMYSRIMINARNVHREYLLKNHVTVVVIWIQNVAVGQTRMTKINFNLGLLSANVMLRFKLDVNFVHSQKFHLYIFSQV